MVCPAVIADATNAGRIVYCILLYSARIVLSVVTTVEPDTGTEIVHLVENPLHTAGSVGSLIILSPKSANAVTDPEYKVLASVAVNALKVRSIFSGTLFVVIIFSFIVII